MILKDIRKNLQSLLDKYSLPLNNNTVNKLYKKGKKGEKNYILSEEELQEPHDNVLRTLGRDGETFDTIVRSVVTAMTTDESGQPNATQVACHCYGV